MPASFARKLAHFIELSEIEQDVLRSMPASLRQVEAQHDIVADGDWPSEQSLLTEGFACRYKLVASGKRQIMALLIPGDICDLRALLTGRMDHAVAALNHCRVAAIPRQQLFGAMEKHPLIELALWRDTMLDAALYRQWLINLGRRGPSSVSPICFANSGRASTPLAAPRSQPMNCLSPNRTSLMRWAYP
jgi:CRP-like cAMP-binding protein